MKKFCRKEQSKGAAKQRRRSRSPPFLSFRRSSWANADPGRGSPIKVAAGVIRQRHHEGEGEGEGELRGERVANIRRGTFPIFPARIPPPPLRFEGKASFIS